MYKSIIAQVDNIQTIAGADNIVLASVLGYSVVVSKTTNVGDVGVLFPDDGKLSPAYLKENNLYRHSNLNKDETKVGFFEDSGQIRAVRLRGVKSECYFASVGSLNFLGDTSKLKIGDEVQEFNGHVVAEKYIPKQTKVSSKVHQEAVRLKHKNLQWMNKFVKRYKKISWIKNLVSQINYFTENSVKTMFPSFKEHVDTEQFRFAVERIEKDSKIIVLDKVHGCVTGDTLVDTLEFGITPISNVVNNKLVCHVKSMNVDTEEIVYKKVSDYYFLENDGDWYELELEDGTKLQITGNNPVWLPTLGVYRQVWDLEVGDVFTKST